jgi:hypothetical protein
MSSWGGARGYDTWLEHSRKQSTEDLLLYVSSDIYCQSMLFSRGMERHHWIILWNSYISLRTTLDALSERGIHSYITRLTAEAIVARLEDALNAKRVKGRESRIARKLAAKSKI